MIDVDVDRRWWIGEGDERCPSCLQGYALEVEVRCVDCDAPGCPHCMIRVRERVAAWCPDCQPAEDEED